MNSCCCLQYLALKQYCPPSPQPFPPSFFAAIRLYWKSFIRHHCCHGNKRGNPFHQPLRHTPSIRLTLSLSLPHFLYLSMLSPVILLSSCLSQCVQDAASSINTTLPYGFWLAHLVLQIHIVHCCFIGWIMLRHWLYELQRGSFCTVYLFAYLLCPSHVHFETQLFCPLCLVKIIIKWRNQQLGMHSCSDVIRVSIIKKN